MHMSILWLTVSNTGLQFSATIEVLVLFSLLYKILSHMCIMAVSVELYTL